MRRTFPHPAKLAVAAGLAILVGLSGTSGATAAPSAGHSPAHNATTVRSVLAVGGSTCTTTSTEARGAADAYLDALISHDAAAVPFAPDVLRVENGIVTGRSAEEIRKDLDTSTKYKIITGLRDRKYTESGPTADGTLTENVDYRLDVGVLDTTLLTVRIRERFDVRCGLITYINANIGL